MGQVVCKTTRRSPTSSKLFPEVFLGVSQGVQAANPHLPIQERSWSDSSNIGNCPLFEGSFHIWMCLKMRSPCSNQVVCHFTFERHPYHFFRHRNIYQQNALCTPTAQISASKLLKTCFLLRTTRSFEHQTKVLHSFSKVHMKNPGADPVRYSPTFFSLHALRLRSRCKKKAASAMVWVCCCCVFSRTFRETY